MPLAHVSIGDICAVVLALCAVATITYDRMTKRRDRTASLARKEALSEQELTTLERELKRIADGLEAANTKQNSHEVECSGFRGRLEADVAAIRKAQESTDRRLENLTAQFGRLLPGADSLVELIPSARARHRQSAALREVARDDEADDDPKA